MIDNHKATEIVIHAGECSWGYMAQKDAEPIALDLSESQYASFTFSVLLSASAGRTCSVVLYNQDDTTNVTGTALTSVSAVPEEKTATLLLGITAGFPVAKKTYILRVSSDIDDPLQPVTCWRASLIAR